MIQKRALSSRYVSITAVIFVSTLFCGPNAFSQSIAPTNSGPAQSDADDVQIGVISNAIDSLKSDTFQQRQVAFLSLVRLGQPAIEALEKNALSEHAEVSFRCIEALAEIAKTENNGKPAIESLTRLATHPKSRISNRAKQYVKTLTMTNVERALEALAATGARLFRNGNGEVRKAIVSLDTQLAWLKYLLTLESVQIRGPQVTDAGLAHLRGHKGISEVSIRLTSITDVGLAELQTLTSLEALTIDGEGLTENGFRWLQFNRSLKKLSIPIIPISDDMLAYIGGTLTLQDVMFGNASITDAGLLKLHNLKALTSLTIKCSDVSDDAFIQLRRALPNLITGSVGGYSIPRTPRFHFSDDQSYVGKAADFSGKQLTKLHIAELQDVSQLTSLFLTRCDIDDEAMGLLSNLPIRRLVLGSATISDKGISLLAGHPTLESLSLYSCNISDETVQFVSGISRLKQLQIHGAPISDTGIATIIENLPNRDEFQHLVLFNCPSITSDGLRQLGQLRSLDQLILIDNPALDSRVFEQVAKLEKLKRFDFYRNPINESDLSHLANLRSIEMLGLSDSDTPTSLTDKSLKHLSGLVTLEALSISSTNITDKGLVHLAPLKNLKTLGVSSTEIGDQGVAEIANRFPALSQLNLASTKVTDLGMKDVARLNELHWLWLDGTRVANDGIRRLDGLKQLVHLYVNKDTVTDEDLADLRRIHSTTNIWRH